MSVICLASAHGAPGVTTTVVALAGAWPPDRTPLLVEADSFGGVVAARLGLADTPGLVSLAAVTRSRALDTEMVWAHAQQLPGGVPVLVGPSSGDQALAVVGDIAASLVSWVRSTPEIDAIVDCGRLTASSIHSGLLRQADTVLMAVRPSVDQLRAAFHRLGVLEAAGIGANLILVGDTPYGAAEVESALGIGVSGVVAWDPPAAAALAGTGGGAKLGRSALVRSVSTLATTLAVTEGEAAGVGS